MMSRRVYNRDTSTRSKQRKQKSDKKRAAKKREHTREVVNVLKEMESYKCGRHFL